MARLTRQAAPLAVLDTHAGAGLYDLAGPEAQRSGEAQAGIARLMADREAPAPLQALASAVRACRETGGDLYPGSPWLAAFALRRQDRYTGFELRADDHAAARLRAKVRADGPRIERVQADGYVEAKGRLAAERDRTLMLIDPPFERDDDYARTADLIAARPRPELQPVLVWTPLKDLETFDAFLTMLEAARPGSLVAAQVRLHPLDDPLRLNGCAMVLVDAPELTAEAETVCAWAAARLGGPMASAKVERLI